MRAKMRQRVLPYLILSCCVRRSLSVRTLGWRLYLWGSVEMFGLDVLENWLKDRWQHMSYSSYLKGEELMIQIWLFCYGFICAKRDQITKICVMGEKIKMNLLSSSWDLLICVCIYVFVVCNHTSFFGDPSVIMLHVWSVGLCPFKNKRPGAATEECSYTLLHQYQ